MDKVTGILPLHHPVPRSKLLNQVVNYKIKVSESVILDGSGEISMIMSCWSFDVHLATCVSFWFLNY